MERETIIPVWGRAGAMLRRRDHVVATTGDARVVMERSDGVVVSVTDAVGQRVEVARIADSVRVPHMALVGSSGYFVGDSRRLYRLDLDRLTVTEGIRIRADKVLPAFGALGVAYVPCVSDSKRGYTTRLSRIVSERELAFAIDVDGELHDASMDEAGRVFANGERGFEGRAFGQGFALSWTPGADERALVTDRPSLYGRVFRALPGIGPAGDIDASGYMRPPRMERRGAYASLVSERSEAFSALERELGHTLPPRYRDLYEASSTEPLLRWRLQRIGVVLVHPGLRERALAVRGLVPFAEWDDYVLCIDASSEIFMPVVRRARDGELTEIAPSFNVFLEAFLDTAGDAWPTTVDQLRATLFGETPAPSATTF